MEEAKFNSYIGRQKTSYFALKHMVIISYSLHM